MGRCLRCPGPFVLKRGPKQSRENLSDKVIQATVQTSANYVSWLASSSDLDLASGLRLVELGTRHLQG
jgi:hypothetical protein